LGAIAIVGEVAMVPSLPFLSGERRRVALRSLQFQEGR